MSEPFVRIVVLACTWALTSYALAADAAAGPPTQRDESRGELLYSTHCITCHDTRMHWRDAKLVTDWPSLLVQVERWQRISGQAWSDDDIAEVARYLNALHYHFKPAD